MANNYWIKLYHEILRDPKMGMLPDNVWRRCIELFLLAGELDTDGQLPCTEELAWHLRQPDPEQLETELEHLARVGILTKTETGWLVTKFADRQAPISDADRMKAYRERKRLEAASGNGKQAESKPEQPNKDPNIEVETDQLQEDNPTVTGSVTIRNADTDNRYRKDTTPTTARAREEIENEFSVCVKEAESVGVKILSRTADLIKDSYLEICPPEDETRLDWFRYAATETAANARGQPTWRYFERVLDSIQQSGSLAAHKANHQNGASSNGHQSGNRKSKTESQTGGAGSLADEYREQNGEKIEQFLASMGAG